MVAFKLCHYSQYQISLTSYAAIVIIAPQLCSHSTVIRIERLSNYVVVFRLWNECKDKDLADFEKASLRWFKIEKIVHFLFFGDKERDISKDEIVYTRRKTSMRVIAARKALIPLFFALAWHVLYNYPCLCLLQCPKAKS